MKRILFCCAMNSIRSPIAASLFQDKIDKLNLSDKYVVSSAGIEEGILDGFVISVMAEKNIDMMDYEPKSLAYVGMQSWDLIITFTQNSYETVQGIAARTGAKVELWDINDPSVFEGNRDQKLDVYRKTRDDIENKIIERFGK